MLTGYAGGGSGSSGVAAMTEQEALMAAVCADPDSDLPRLVYADWYDDHGEPERAEYIRLGCRLHALRWEAGGGGGGVDALAAVGVRAEQLWAHHWPEWRDQLPPADGVSWLSGGRWPRGFADRVVADSVGAFVTHADAVMAAAPVVEMAVRQVRDLKPLLTHPSFRRVRRLSLNWSGLTDRAAHDLLRAGRADHLVLVCVAANPLSGRLVRRLEERFGTRLVAGHNRGS